MSKKLQEEIDQLKTAKMRLEEALAAEKTQLNQDAAIQRFEFTFELLWKTLKTYAEDKGLKANSPRDAFRVAAQLEIIPDPEPFFNYLEKRNLSSHTYSESEASTIYAAITDFPQAIDSVLTKLI